MREGRRAGQALRQQYQAERRCPPWEHVDFWDELCESKLALHLKAHQSAGGAAGTYKQFAACSICQEINL